MAYSATLIKVRSGAWHARSSYNSEVENQMMQHVSHNAMDCSSMWIYGI